MGWLSFLWPFARKAAERIADQDGDGDFDEADLVKLIMTWSPKLLKKGLHSSAQKLSEAAASIVKESQEQAAKQAGPAQP